ncbi:RNA-binding transcriptional accessory protein OS=Lysinibacillus sphaericus OX=1421 GN=LS41612_02625 PE=4 SV=1 [Lysinibacillus sphaericus]
MAENIVKVPEENGQFTTRAQLKKIPRLGAKTYEQAIGFLRVPEAKNPFDATGIHPESYNIAEQILDAAHINKKELGTQKAEEAIAALNVQVLVKV